MINEGYLARHYQGRKGGRDVALLDVAQDYALKLLFDAALFELGLTFKGGTALRKYRAGSAGRFSTDLDFAVEDPDLGEMVMETLDGGELYDVAFSVEVVTPGRRGRLQVETPLGSPQIDAKLDIGRRGVWLTPEVRNPVSLPVHRGYEFEPVSLPLMTLEETLAEKLAAFRRRALARDLYDLAWFGQGVFDPKLLRRLTYLKVFIDVVEDNLASVRSSAGHPETENGVGIPR
ncbi:MAG: nucleotidyl transferase AbiEii/AbiGii toxin family protein [Actinomycetota bacterium]|nr:nucleotidyl transferase AbiEii/AbiGii toxin family protein [Actinomycetota bacterium]